MSETNTIPGSPRTAKFTPPKGYGGFIPVIDEVAEGEWTLGVAPAPQTVALVVPGGVSHPAVPKDAATTAAGSAVSSMPIRRPAQVSAAASEPLVAAAAPAARHSLDEIPLRPPAVPLQGTLERYSRGTEVASPLSLRAAASPEVSPQPRHRSTILWVVVIALALGLAGETWYFVVMRRQNIQLSRLPGIARVASTLGIGSRSLGRRASAPAEQKVAAVSPDIPPTTSPVPAVAPPAGPVRDTSTLHAAASQENSAGRQTVSTPAAQLAPPGQSDTGNTTPQATAKPQRRVGREVRHRVETRPKQLAPDAILGLRAAQDRAAPSRPAAPAPAPAERPRVDFEVATNIAREIVPGISLRVTATNVRQQRYDGYLWLMSEGSALWLSNVAVERPIVFYPRGGGQADSIVVTRITRDSVIGYLLQPLGEVPAQGSNFPPRSQAARLYAEFTPARKKGR